MTDRNIKLNLEYPMFEDQIEPKGRLNFDKGSHACWYYLMLATKNGMRVGRGPEDQIIEVDAGEESKTTWMDLEFDRIARSVAMLYGLDSPDDFLRFMPLAIKEAIRLDIAVDPRAFEPYGVKGGVTH